MASIRREMQKLPDDITLLVNNAGYANIQSFLEVTEEAFDR